MKLPDFLASTGVIILLIAFLLNMYKKLTAQSKAYTFMNFIGAVLCCTSSILIRFYPFVVLEAIWAIFALLSLFNVPRGTSNDKS
jgi:uncharacterized membrane protein